MRRQLCLIPLIGYCALSTACTMPVTARRVETGASLEGTVKYGDQKVTVALVIAQGATGSSTAFIDDDGRYKLDNVPLGEVTLAVNSDAGKGQLMGRLMSQSKGKSKVVPRAIDIPAKFADPTKSGIKTTIAAGSNTFDIVLPR